MSGPPPKQRPPGDRSAKGKAAAKVSIDVEVLPARVAGTAPPAPPAGLPDEVAAEWVEFWSSPLAATVATTDLPALRRLFRLRGRHAELLQLAEGEGLLTLGSTGQEVLHPALRAAKELEAGICAIEDRFGLSVRARQTLGIGMGALADAEKRHPGLLTGAAQEDRPRADPRVADSGAPPPEPRGGGGGLDGEPPPALRG